MRQFAVIVGLALGVSAKPSSLNHSHPWMAPARSVVQKPRIEY
jgi:hypothetical protein